MIVFFHTNCNDGRWRHLSGTNPVRAMNHEGLNISAELHRQAVTLVNQVLHDYRAGIVSHVVTLRVLTKLCEQFSNQVIVHIL